MIKSEIRSTIKNLLPKYGFEKEYHPRVLDAVIEKVLALFYNYIYAVDSLALQRFCKRYGTTTTVTVSYDANAGIYYSSYPQTIIPFPDKASGVRRVTTKAQGGMSFYPMDQREMDLVMDGSFTNYTSTKIGYVPTQDRIEYFNMTAAIATDGVRMDLIIPFSKYADTDTVLVPEITDPQGKTFTDVVMQTLSSIPPVDLKDDNAAPVMTKEQ